MGSQDQQAITMVSDCRSANSEPLHQVRFVASVSMSNVKENVFYRSWVLPFLIYTLMILFNAQAWDSRLGCYCLLVPYCQA